MEQPSLDDRMWKRGHSQVISGEHMLQRGACVSVHSTIMISTKVERGLPSEVPTVRVMVEGDAFGAMSRLH